LLLNSIFFVIILFLIKGIRDILQLAGDLTRELMYLVGVVNGDSITNSDHDEAVIARWISDSDSQMEYHVGFNLDMSILSIDD
jgi:hypothetical protein